MKFEKDWMVEVVTELYNAGTTEDGHPYEAECYYLQINKPNGTNLIHDKIWFTAEKETSPDGFYYFSDDREKMMDIAVDFKKRVRDSGEINEIYWAVGEPSYGSEAYCLKYGF